MQNDNKIKNKEDNFKNKNLYQAFNNAMQGIIYEFKTQRNAKFQYFIATLVLIFTLFMNVDKIEFLLLCVSITFVLVTELINTAIEKVVDLLVDVYHPLAKIAKDVAAGAVVISCFNSVIVGFFIFKDKLNFGSQMLLNVVIKEKSYYTIIIMLVVFIGVIVLKAIFDKGTPLEGGMPSGHVAFSFATLTLVVIYSKNIYISVLTLILTLIIAHSRYQYGIHKISEIIFGAFWGTIVVLIMYYLLLIKGSVV